LFSVAGDLGEKLKEKEGELKKVKDDMAAMKKDLEGQLAAANASSKTSSEALKVDLSKGHLMQYMRRRILVRRRRH
jgi:Skp family chaperone for outer membrane proteins